MSTLPWTPWHSVVKLRDDVRSGELSLSIFAADLYDVVMGVARPVYQDPREFFALTYPTVALRDLARDVALRLAGKNDKAVRQLELTYGGGKTHTLITLYHLTRDPAQLPTDLPTVQEFLVHTGMTPPQARIAVLAFDKLDVEKGMEIIGPNGERRWLKQPWSVLAWQIAGAEGLQLLHPDNLAEERASAPAENLLTALLKIPEREGLATLILLDEVLMFAREKIGLDPRWRDTLVNFFQYLTQAAVKAPRCAIVASLLATDPRRSDTLGKEITQDLYAVFQREREQSVQPVQKEDAAEVLRRRFFTPDSLRDRNAFRAHVGAAAQGIFGLDEQSAKDRAGTEEHLLDSYPFHPALTDIFYTKWTNLEGFQRTRGVLRTFALALRDAESWDTSPLVGVNVFLNRPGVAGLSEAAREVTTVAETEEYEGKRQAWTQILEGEFTKAREIQQETSGLHHREVEQAVFATFLHSQPIGQKASTRDLIQLLGPTRPDKIDLEKALKEWVQTSWFLDETALGEGQTGALTGDTLPRFWRLGSKPNLRQMHHDARGRINADVVNELLESEIGKVGSLKAGLTGSGVRVHLLPRAPSDVQDDGDFHFAILGPHAASSPGRLSPEAVRYLTETTNSERPRVHRNAVMLVVPSLEGIEAARNAIRDHLAWQEVQGQLKGQDVDPVRSATLAMELSSAQKRIPDSIQQAYCIVVTMSAKSEPEVFKITPAGESLFATIKADSRARITESAISADALLPGGPYDLWREGEPTRRVKDLVGAFAQYPSLPKMLNTQAVLDTLVAGCREGIFVLQTPRPDRTYRTFWREEPDPTALRDPALEAALPESATVASIAAPLLAPGILPDLWQSQELHLDSLIAYFAGGKVVQVNRGSYTEPMSIPAASRQTIEEAVRAAVRDGVLWLTSGPTSLYQEDVPDCILSEATILHAPPQPVKPQNILAPNLPEAWANGTEVTTALDIANALSTQLGKALPWSVVSLAIQSAFTAHYLERMPDSGEWPCDAGGASAVRIRVPSSGPQYTYPPASLTPAMPHPGLIAESRPGVRTAEANLSTAEIQNLADQIGDLKKLATEAGTELTFRLRIEISGSQNLASESEAKLNAVLQKVSGDLKIG
jgi:uncharacterized protein DUF499